MEKILAANKYPGYKMEILKADVSKNFEQIVDCLIQQIKEDEVASLIAKFDHYAHTQSLNGEILPDVKNVNILVFCFGKAINNLDVLIARPRNLVIIETADKFIFEWLEAPQAPINEKIKGWITNCF
jgi:hypothetical protein